MEAVQDMARKDLEKIFYQDPRSQIHLKAVLRRPALARVKAVHEDTGHEVEVIVCDGMPPVGDGGNSGKRIQELEGRVFASDASVMGRIASFSPGRVFQGFEVLEVDKLFPCGGEDEPIDSKGTQVRVEDRNPITLSSLRKYLKSLRPEASFDWLDEEPGDEEAAQVTEGLVRRERLSFGLQRVIVSEEQDEVYSRPIDSQIILLGAPGTGKTTTMVQRLRSKLAEGSGAELSPEDAEAVRRAEELGALKNWLIFTPTELLKQYVRNALDRQGLSRLNDQMTTWEDFSDSLAKWDLKILRSNQNKGGFILLEDGGAWLARSAVTQPILFYEAFRAHRDAEFLRLFASHAQCLRSSGDEGFAKAGAELEAMLVPGASPIGVLSGLHGISEQLRIRVADRQEEAEQSIKAFCEECTRRIPNLRSGWTAFLKQEADEKLAAQAAAEDDEEELSEEELEEAVTESEQTVKFAPGPELKNTLRRYCLALVSGKKPSKSLQKRLAFLARGLPAPDAAKEIGRRMREISAARALRRSFKWYAEDSWKTFRTFRSGDLKKDDPEWFLKGEVKKTEICRAELDLMVLLRLQTMQSLWESRPMKLRHGDELREMASKFCRMMVFVDEATDFSPVQLAAMRALAHPALKSFFASGDINQRLAETGIRSEDELLWAAPGAEIHRLKTAFRQTRALHEIGQAFLAAGHEGETDDSAVQDELSSEGDMKPALCEHAGSLAGEALWVSERIVEMIPFYDAAAFPTVAVFVRGREDVEPFSEALKKSAGFVENNLRVQACPDGRSVGEDAKIGVYPIEFVKGLEFEAVFFTEVDGLARSAPALFGQYLYVGATRASRFLGVSCREELPVALQSLEGSFCSRWGAE